MTLPDPNNFYPGGNDEASSRARMARLLAQRSETPEPESEAEEDDTGNAGATVAPAEQTRDDDEGATGEDDGDNTTTDQG